MMDEELHRFILHLIDGLLITNKTSEMYIGELLRFHEKIGEYTVGCRFFHELHGKVIQFQYMGQHEDKHIYRLLENVSWTDD